MGITNNCIYKPASSKIAVNIMKKYSLWDIGKVNSLEYMYKYFNLYIFLLNEYKDSESFIDGNVIINNDYLNNISKDEFDVIYNSEKELQYLLTQKCK